jgi:hypothetical protein
MVVVGYVIQVALLSTTNPLSTPSVGVAGTVGSGLPVALGVVVVVATVGGSLGALGGRVVDSGLLSLVVVEARDFVLVVVFGARFLFLCFLTSVLWSLL